MKLFISWSGKYSLGVALALRDWLPILFTGIDVFVSSEDIRKGQRWSQVVAKELDASNLGIACLTPGNLKAPWILFESGALSKSIKQGSVYTLLFGGLPEGRIDGPLSQFQHTIFEKEDFFKLVKAINEAHGQAKQDDGILRRVFDKFWDELEKTIAGLPFDPAQLESTGFVLHPNHRLLPPREQTLNKLLKKELRIFTTTADSYFLNRDIRAVLRKKLNAGCTVRVLLLSRESPYMQDRQYQERTTLASQQTKSVEEMQKLQVDFPDQVQYRYFNCAPTYQALIIDHNKAFVSLPLYGHTGIGDFPCLELTAHDGGNDIIAKLVDSFEKLWTESGSYSYDLIAYHDSWLAVDPVIHCNYNCKYCVLQIQHWTNKKPKQIEEVDSTVVNLLQNRFFIRGQSVLSFGNRTDPFSPINVPVTLQFIRELEAKGITNTLCLPTKSAIPPEALDLAKSLKSLKLIFFLSLSGFNNDIEEGVNHQNIKGNFVTLHRRNIRFVHFWRPVTAINATPTAIRTMLDFAAKYAAASVVIGLKYSPELKEAFSKHPALRIASQAVADYGEWLPAEILDEIMKTAKTMYRGYPLFRHTSCAVSYLQSSSDYNASYCFDGFCDSCICPSAQRRRCRLMKRYRPSRKEIAERLKNVGLETPFEVKADAIHLHKPVSQEEFTYLLQTLRYPIKSGIGYTNVWRGDIFDRMNC